MKYYAVIDTNVLVAALFSKKKDAATVKVVDAILRRQVIPLYHPLILQEYIEVLHREKFHFSNDKKSKNRIIRINTGILSNMKQKIKEFYH